MDIRRAAHGHESIDVTPKVIIVAALLLAAGIVISYFAAFGIWTLLLAIKPSGIPSSPLAPPRNLPPAPRLQVTPAVDLAILRQKEDLMLNSYGWTDSKSQTVRIPIARAIDLLAERGLPVTPPVTTIPPVSKPQAQEHTALTKDPRHP